MTRNASTGVVHVIRTQSYYYDRAQSYYYDRAEKITFNTFALPTFVLLLALTHVEKHFFPSIWMSFPRLLMPCSY